MESKYVIPVQQSFLTFYIYFILKYFSNWFYGVVVSTLDFESSDLGSTPGRTLFFNVQ